MFNQDLVISTIIETIGEKEYQENLYKIANILSKLYDNDYAKAGVVNPEILMAEDALRKLNNSRAQIKGKDIMDDEHLYPIIEEIVDSPEYGNVRMVTEIGRTARTQIRSTRDLLDAIEDIKIKMENDSTLYLTKIRVGDGKQTANDFLSDVAGKSVHTDSKPILELIEKVRKLSRMNYDKTANKTAQIRDMITKEDLKSLKCKELCAKYNLDFKDGKIRMFISRLKKKEAYA